MKMLLHMCCGPCTTSSQKKFKNLGYELTGYFFNPNIHPYKEFQKRLETLQGYCKDEDIPLISDTRYLLEDFISGVVNWEGVRCDFCYFMRLKETAKKAKGLHIPNFSSTLLISPYQKHDSIKKTGEEVAKKYGVNFVYTDLRPLYKESVEISRRKGLYRQPYCGCVFSEKERYYT